MSNPELHIYNSKQETAEAFADYFASFVRQREDNVHVALSGGSTPILFFDYLAEKHHDRIDWEKVHFYWGDERCVPPNDPESNFRMTNEHLLSKIDIPDANIHRIEAENGDTEVERYGKEIDSHVPHNSEDTPVFDMIILGMGDDGHTASIFPNSLDLLEKDSNTALAVHPESGQFRITLTGKILNQASNVSFLVTGDSKQQKVKEVIEKSGDYSAYPASYINPDGGELHWFLDQEAATFLQ